MPYVELIINWETPKRSQDFHKGSPLFAKIILTLNE